MPHKSKRGGTFRNITNNKYLTEDQAKFVYMKVNTGTTIDTKAMKQEMEKEKVVGTEIENTYQKAILTDINKTEKTPHR